MAPSLAKASLLLAAAASLSAAAPWNHDNYNGGNQQWQSSSTTSASVADNTWAPSTTASPFGQPSATPSSSSSPPPAFSNGTSTTSTSPLKPGGKKAGSAGGRAVPFWSAHLGWWYDWTPSPGNQDAVVGAAMLWGDGENGPEDAKRYQAFQQLYAAAQYLLGFNEPDCQGAPDVSASMSVEKAVQVWNEQVAPWGDKGALLGSPSMCMQLAETWLEQFSQGGLSKEWDFTAIHVYKPDMDGVRQDLDHYWEKYGKPIWVTEFACVYDQDGFRACSDQGEINQWIKDVVDLFEGDERVYAYGYTDGGGLNDQWLPTNNGESLSESGQTYLDAISKY